MKSTVPIALASLVLGIAIGWLAKPAGTNTAAANDSAQPAASPPGDSRPTGGPAPAAGSPADTDSKPDRRLVAKTGAEDQPDEDMQQALEDAQKQQQRMITKALGSKYDLRIEAIVEELGLDEGQEKELRAYFDQQLEIIGSANSPFMMGNEPDPEKISEIADALRGAGLEDHLAEHLDDEQREALADYQSRQEQNAVEARALKDFARVQSSLDLNDEQRDQVYEVMLEEATEWRENQSDIDYVSREMMSAMGMEMNFGDFDMGALMETGNPGEMDRDERTELFANIRKQQEQKLEARIERMAPILNETQLERYRKSLQQRGGMLHMMMDEELRNSEE